jgi:hypothetical protein
MSEQNKTIVAIFDASADSVGGYNQVTEALQAVGAGSPKGRLFHVAYEKEGGYIVVDVWKSRELFDQFSRTLGSVVQKLGGTPGVPQIYPVVNIIEG